MLPRSYGEGEQDVYEWCMWVVEREGDLCHLGGEEKEGG